MAIRAARPSCIPACLVFLALSLGVADAKGRLNEPDPMCTGDARVRLRIENRCADDVWAVVTSPGGNAQIAMRAQWDWINAYASQGLLCEDTPPIVIKASSAFVGTSATYPNGVRLPNYTYYADKANRHICPVPWPSTAPPPLWALTPCAS